MPNACAGFVLRSAFIVQHSFPATSRAASGRNSPLMLLTARQTFVVLIAGAYLLGSVPFGLLVGLARGIDVRSAGSGNIGATNVGRLLGNRYFFLVFFLDLLKSLVPMVLGTWIALRSTPDQTTYVLWLMVGLAAVFGHMYSIFLKFKGGKGVATSAGVMLGLWPFYTVPAVFAILVFLAVLFTTRYMSVASMSGAVAFPFIYLVIALHKNWDPLGQQLPLLIAGGVMAIFLIYKHRGNIARLRAGTENRMGRKTASDITPPGDDGST
jgi:glycerol-3-phosphate acyltransferase PlsY